MWEWLIYKGLMMVSSFLVIPLSFYAYRQWRFWDLRWVIPIQDYWLWPLYYVRRPEKSQDPTPLQIHPSIRWIALDPTKPKVTTPFLYPNEIRHLQDILTTLPWFQAHTHLELERAPPKLGENVFFIGGSDHIEWVERFDKGTLKGLGFVLKERSDDDHCETYTCKTHTNEVRSATCEHTGTGTRHEPLKRDAAVILRFSEPTAKKRKNTEILICRGIHSFGTAAAVAVALNEQFQQSVRASGFKQFAQLLDVPIFQNTVPDPTRNLWAAHDLINLTPLRPRRWWQFWRRVPRATYCHQQQA